MEPPVMRADAVANRQAILRAARDVLSLGTESGSIEQIARAAGLSRRTVYGHFPTREHLVRALAQQVADEVAEQLAAVTPSEDPLETLARFVHATSSIAAGSHPLSPLARIPEAREELAGSLQRVRARLAELLTAALPQLDLGGATPGAAAHLIGAVQWGLLDAVAQGDLDEADAAPVTTRSVLRALGVSRAHADTLVAAL